MADPQLPEDFSWTNFDDGNSFNENPFDPIMDFQNNEENIFEMPPIVEEEAIDFNKIVPDQLKDDLCFQNYVQKYRYMTAEMFKKTFTVLIAKNEKEIISKELLVCYERLILMMNQIPLISRFEKRDWQRYKNKFYLYYCSYAPIIFYWIKILMENGIINYLEDKKMVSLARNNDKKRCAAGVKCRRVKLNSKGNQRKKQNCNSEVVTLRLVMINYFDKKFI